MNLFCCDLQRRNEIRGKALNGIDFVEVLDRNAASAAQRQRRIFVHFVNAPVPTFSVNNVRISGGERVRDIRVVAVEPDPENNRVLNVDVDQPGDHSPYTLRLQKDDETLAVPGGIDPALAAIDFSFKAECPSELDCRPVDACVPEPDIPPEIDYLAKDYGTFRRLMLDRISALSPGWKDRNSADLGVALVELLAYIGDRLSYRQDAIGTEAYIGSARRRVSVRRHARLVDYVMHDGCNARAWVQVAVTADLTGPGPVIPRGTQFCTAIPGYPAAISDPDDVTKADVVFEAMEHTAALFAGHNVMPFYAWSDERCCLPAGATTATLAGHYPHLETGQVLVFEEVVGPLTGDDADADPSQRWAVRLCQVRAFDETQNPLIDTVTNAEITEIEWMAQDALRFPICVSSRTDVMHGEHTVEGVSVARGNIVLVDQGRSVQETGIPEVPEASLYYPPSGGWCDPGGRLPVRPRYRVTLKEGPLSQASPLDPNGPASLTLYSDPRAAVPAISLDDGSDTAWTAIGDLLGSSWSNKDFVAEVEVDGTTTLRFGDDRHGRFPDPGTSFIAYYRVGNGTAGNVGRDAIRHILLDEPAIESVRNPLAAAGGVDPESMEEVRQSAPQAFRVPMRAVTEADYAAIAERKEGIQRAAAAFRWTGSWHTVYLMADQLGEPGHAEDATLEEALIRHVEPYRMAGYDLDADSPRYAYLELQIDVCARQDFFRSDVRQALLGVLSNRLLPGGQRGVFHPDNFTFGQTVYLSPIYRAAQLVPGVETVDIVKFGRQGVRDPKPLRDGMLRVSGIEIARLDNDPDFPERGVLTLTVRGGK